MNYIVGNAIKILDEVDIVSGTTVTVESIVDPSGITVASDLATSFDTVNTSLAFAIWQSTSGTHEVGKYTFTMKAVNGIYTNKAKGSFYLEEA